jgi:ComF family protein
MLGRLLADRCAGREPGIILPVPLHPARRRARGFNQAHEIARPIASRIGAPLRVDACCRVVDTPAQAGLSAERRYRNLQDAFRVDSGLVQDERLALVDDVFTTGSTARALAEALLRAGAQKVEVWAVARGGTSQAGVKV